MSQRCDVYPVGLNKGSDRPDRDIIIPENAILCMGYKQRREVEKLEFKIYWDMREDFKLEANQKSKLLN